MNLNHTGNFALFSLLVLQVFGSHRASCASRARNVSGSLLARPRHIPRNMPQYQVGPIAGPVQARSLSPYPVRGKANPIPQSQMPLKFPGVRHSLATP